jgi:AcrR family transcriptional regulator
MKTARTKSAAAELGASTRKKLLDVAVDCLIELGVAGTTTLAVQHKAGVSRGALLHHFPNHATLLAAAVAAIVERNEQAIADSLEHFHGAGDSLEAAVKALAFSARQPAYLAELELWAVSRTNKALRSALIAAERSARRDIERVYSKLFEEWAGSEAFEEIVLLTQTFISGLAISENVRSSPKNRERSIAAWSKAIRFLLEGRLNKKVT